MYICKKKDIMRNIDIIKRSNRDYWMGWAMIMIILCHIQYTCYDDGYIMRCLRVLFKKGEFGVDIFLFLSSVGLSYSIISNNIRTFYKHRITRLFPMYFLFLFLSYCFFKSNELSWNVVFFQIVGISNFVGNPFNEWYVPAIILIYTSFPILFFGIKGLCAKSILWGIALILLAIYSYTITINYMTLYFARRLYVIILGIVTFFVHHEKQNPKGVIYVLLFVALMQLFVPSDYNMFLFVPLLLVLFDVLFPKLPMHRIVGFIGKHSLELYLGQTMGIIYYCNQSSIRILYKLPVGLIITIVSAILLYWGHRAFYICMEKMITYVSHLNNK